MKFKTLMLIKAVVSLFFGIAFIFSPSKLFLIFGVPLSGGAVFPAWEYGAALFGNMTLTWYARNAAESDARLAIIRALFVYDAIGVIMSLIAVFKGLLNPLGWLVVIIYLFFTLVYGYFLMVKPKDSETIS
jgi:hypothetical protein